MFNYLIKLFGVSLQNVGLRRRDDLKAEPPLGVHQGPDHADPQIILHHRYFLARPLHVQQLVVLKKEIR